MVKTRPDDGGYIHGLFMEGANWDNVKRHIIESSPKVLFNSMPTIWLKPTQDKGVVVTRGGKNYNQKVYYFV